MNYALPARSPTSIEATGGVAKQSGGVAKQPTRIYTDAEIRELTSDGYIVVFPGLWDHIPRGAHIRFQKRDDGAGKPRGARFKPGGFVRSHYTTADNRKMMLIETKPNGNRGDPGYVSFPIAYDDLETLWKKYDHSAFIEIHLIHNSLAQKKQQIEVLTERITRLEAALRK